MNPYAADLPHRLREALLTAAYDVEAVAERLGTRAHTALGRNETTPGLGRTGDGSPLSTLIRLFLLQGEVSRTDADRALPALVDELVTAGFLATSSGEVRAALDIRPYASDDTELWVVSDLTPGMDGGPLTVSGDYVLGISPASISLAQMTSREPVARALDLGTGCGVQALHLAAHSGHVVATDVNQKALWVTRFNLVLNAINDGPGEDRVEVRDGSFFEPVAGERFDLIATNPPFVISPATSERLVYRDSGLPGDEVVEHIVRTAPQHLTETGKCQILANWAIAKDIPWDARLAGWLGNDVDALIVQREVLDPAAYVELWLKDAGQHGGRDYLRRYDDWLRWFDTQGIEGIGFGWISLFKTGSDHTKRELVEWPYEVEQPIAPALDSWWEAVHAEVTEVSRLVRAEAVEQETVGAPGAEDPRAIVLRQQRGLRRARKVDTVEAALVGACDGELSIGQILDALASILDQNPTHLRDQYLPVVKDLVREGFLTLL